MFKSKIYYTFFTITIVIFYLLADVSLCMTPVGSLIYILIKHPALTIRTIPSYALVDIVRENGSYVRKGSRSPVRIAKISNGVYELRLQKKGYNSVTRRAAVQGGKVTFTGGTVHPDPEDLRSCTIPLGVTLSVHSYPLGADVLINGEKLKDPTPAVVQLDASVYAVALKKKGFDGVRADTEALHHCIIDFAKPVSEQNGMNAAYWKLNAAELNNEAWFQLKGTLVKRIMFDSVPSGAAFDIETMTGRQGKTPSGALLIPAGSHTISYRLPGYAPEIHEVVIDEKTSRTMVMHLRREINFSAQAKASGHEDIHARVTIPGTEVRERLTPFTVALPVSTYTAVFTKEPAYQKTVQRINAAVVADVNVFMQPRQGDAIISIADCRTEHPIPGAEMIIDSRKCGKTDDNGTWEGALLPGSHTVVIDTQGRYPEKTADITGAGGGMTAERILLSPFADCTLIIDTRPYFIGARIFLNGDFKGETIRKITGVSRGSNRIAVRHAKLDREISTPVFFNEQKSIVLKIDEQGNFYQE